MMLNKKNILAMLLILTHSGAFIPLPSSSLSVSIKGGKQLSGFIVMSTSPPTGGTTTTVTTSSAKGGVTLGPYKNGALSISVNRPTVSEDAVNLALQALEKKRFKLTPVRFVEEGGTRMGHTIICDWKATYVKGGNPSKFNLQPGAILPKADVKGFMLELTEEQMEPLASFARHVATGMGQMESKVFEVEMPESATIESWRGVTVKVMLLVRSINVKEDLPPDTRSEEEKKGSIRNELMEKAELESRKEVIASFRRQLLESTQTETEKMQASVSWAKFGENSLKDYQWSIIQEAIAEVEGLDFAQVPMFLLEQNPVTYFD